MPLNFDLFLIREISIDFSLFLYSFFPTLSLPISPSITSYLSLHSLSLSLSPVLPPSLSLFFSTTLPHSIYLRHLFHLFLLLSFSFSLFLFFSLSLSLSLSLSCVLGWSMGQQSRSQKWDLEPYCNIFRKNWGALHVEEFLFTNFLHDFFYFFFLIPLSYFSLQIFFTYLNFIFYYFFIFHATNCLFYFYSTISCLQSPFEMSLIRSSRFHNYFVFLLAFLFLVIFPPHHDFSALFYFFHLKLLFWNLLTWRINFFSTTFISILFLFLF